jgi:hypothetical protein
MTKDWDAMWISLLICCVICILIVAWHIDDINTRLRTIEQQCISREFSERNSPPRR